MIFNVPSSSCVSRRTVTAEMCPLYNTAYSLLRGLVENARRNGNEYIFTNPQTQTRFTTIKTAWGTACEKAGITALRFHIFGTPLARARLTTALRYRQCRRSLVTRQSKRQCSACIPPMRESVEPFRQLRQPESWSHFGPKNPR